MGRIFPVAFLGFCSVANSAVLYSSVGSISDFDDNLNDSALRSDTAEIYENELGVLFILDNASTIESANWAGYNWKCCDADLSVGDQFPDNFTITVYEASQSAVGEAVFSINVGSSISKVDSGVDDYDTNGTFYADLYSYTADFGSGISLDAGTYLFSITNDTAADDDQVDSWWWATTAENVWSPTRGRNVFFPEWGTDVPSSRYFHQILTVSGTVVPVPAAVWLFASGLGLLGWMRRRQAA